MTDDCPCGMDCGRKIVRTPMRHFKTGHASHFATAMPVDPHPQWVELVEGDDGKCDWCRAADERQAKMLNR